MARSFTFKICGLSVVVFLLCAVIMKPAVAGSYEAAIARIQKIISAHDDLMQRLGTRINPTCDNCHMFYDQIEERYNAYMLQHATLVSQSGRLTQERLAANLSRFATQMAEYHDKIVREYDLEKSGTLCGKCGRDSKKDRVKDAKDALLTWGDELLDKCNDHAAAMKTLNSLPEPLTEFDRLRHERNAYLSEQAYGDSSRPLPGGLKPLSIDLVPPDLRSLYDPSTGFFKVPRRTVEKDDQTITESGLDALLVQDGQGNITVAFAGTTTKDGRTGTLSTDIKQEVGGMPDMYLEAAGLIRGLLLTTHFNNTNIEITGHSLGGGLAQFALIANSIAGMDSRLSATAYNPATLNAYNVARLCASSIASANQNMQTVRISGDPISIRERFGSIRTLPAEPVIGPGWRHSMNNIRVAISKNL